MLVASRNDTLALALGWERWAMGVMDDLHTTILTPSLQVLHHKNALRS